LEVLDVSEASNAAIKGVRAGDVLISLNGLPLITEGIGYDVVVEAIGQEFNDGKEVELAFFRGSVMGGVDGFVGLMDGILSGDEELEVEQVREGRERRQAESAGRQRAQAGRERSELPNVRFASLIAEGYLLLIPSFVASLLAFAPPRWTMIHPLTCLIWVSKRRRISASVNCSVLCLKRPPRPSETASSLRRRRRRGKRRGDSWGGCSRGRLFRRMITLIGLRTLRLVTTRVRWGC